MLERLAVVRSSTYHLAHKDTKKIRHAQIPIAKLSAKTYLRLTLQKKYAKSAAKFVYIKNKHYLCTRFREIQKASNLGAIV